MSAGLSARRRLWPFATVGLILAAIPLVVPIRLLWFGAQPAWYESEYMPLTVALVTFFALAIAWPVDGQAWLCGLLTTLPPYGAGLLFLLLSASNSSDSDYSSTVVATVLMALSGSVLNPLIVLVVKRLRSRSGKESGPPQGPNLGSGLGDGDRT